MYKSAQAATVRVFSHGMIDKFIIFELANFTCNARTATGILITNLDFPYRQLF